MLFLIGTVIRWCEIGRELERRDDSCRRHWFTVSSIEDKMEMKKLSIKNKEHTIENCGYKRNRVVITDDVSIDNDVSCKFVKSSCA